MQIHHIVPQADGGSGAYDNGIPLCLDCHAEVESRSTIGRRFSQAELRLHRDQWFALVQQRPEVLLAGSGVQTETGPLEALLAELEYNVVCVSGPADEGWPPLADAQFRRAIETNAVATLPPEPRTELFECYAVVARINYHFAELAAMDRQGGRGGPWAAAVAARNQLRDELKADLPELLADLRIWLSIEAGTD